MDLDEVKKIGDAYMSIQKLKLSKIQKVTKNGLLLFTDEGGDAIEGTKSEEICKSVEKDALDELKAFIQDHEKEYSLHEMRPTKCNAIQGITQVAFAYFEPDEDCNEKARKMLFRILFEFYAFCDGSKVKRLYIPLRITENVPLSIMMHLTYYSLVRYMSVNPKSKIQQVILFSTSSGK